MDLGKDSIELKSLNNHIGDSFSGDSFSFLDGFHLFKQKGSDDS